VVLGTAGDIDAAVNSAKAAIQLDQECACTIRYGRNQSWTVI